MTDSNSINESAAAVLAAGLAGFSRGRAARIIARRFESPAYTPLVEAVGWAAVDEAATDAVERGSYWDPRNNLRESQYAWRGVLADALVRAGWTRRAAVPRATRIVSWGR